MAGTLLQLPSYAQTGIRIAMLLALCKEWTLDRRRVPPTSPGKNSEEQRLKVGLEHRMKNKRKRGRDPCTPL
jgi:hypothetical protein